MDDKWSRIWKELTETYLMLLMYSHSHMERLKKIAEILTTVGWSATMEMEPFAS
jgi:hypothetical protein